MRTIRELPVLHKPTSRDIQQQIAKSEPALLTGLVEAWPASHRWSLDYLRTESGARKVPVELHRSGEHGLPHATREMQVQELIEQIEPVPGADRLYLSEVRIEERLPELAKDIRRPGYLDGENLTPPVIFIGKDTFSSFHYHPVGEATLFQVRGDKRVVLVAPRHGRVLPTKTFLRRSFNSSWATSERDWPTPPDEIVDVTVKQGEALYIPIHWWHCVYGADLTMSVTMFWLAARRRVLMPPLGLRYGLPAIALHRSGALPLLFGRDAGSKILRGG